MTYIELINRYWKLNKECSFTSYETHLYFKLLDTCNSLGWKNPFSQSNRYICGEIGVSEPKLIDLRNKLKQYGLIDFESGKIKREKTQYFILGLTEFSLNHSQSNSLNDSLTDSLNGENRLDNIRHISRKDKEIDSSPVSPVGEPQVPASKIIDLYNELCKNLQPVKILTEKRRKAINARIREHGFEKVSLMLQNASKSSFLAGQNNRGWTADLDWLFKPENFAKTLEGKYDDRNKPEFQGTVTNGKDSNFSYLEGAFERLTQQS